MKVAGKEFTDGAGNLVALASLVPLPEALERIAERVRIAGDGIPAFIRNERFDGLACSVCALVPVYVNQDGAIRALSDDEINKGVFRRGGAQMYFIDGRAALSNLGVTEDAIRRVIATLDGSLPEN
jgi:hypothetical protein